MESFFRYVAYVDYYQNNNRICNVGFLKWRCFCEEHTVEIKVKDLPKNKMNCVIREINSGKEFGLLFVEQGMANFEKKFVAKRASGENYIELESGRLYLKDIQGFEMEVMPEEYLRVFLSFEEEVKKEITQFKENIVQNNQDEEIVTESKKEKFEYIEERIKKIEENNDAVKIKQERSDNQKEEIQEIKKEENAIIHGIQEKYEMPIIRKEVEVIKPIPEDKWELLCLEYPKVHPFPGGKVFLSIKPKDFIILRQEYQKLVNNSFLLHGFYNYGHMIMGKLSEEEQAPFYIGVPGVYYEREKQAAQMFGFVGFEGTSQPVQQGSYGYYMIEVEI